LRGFAGAVEIAAQACSVGLAGELDSAAQVSCEKAVRKRCARVATRSGHLALFVYPPSMDMLGSALVYIYIYIHISSDLSEYPWISMDIHGHPWILVDIHGYQWISMDVLGYLWKSMDMSTDFHEYQWVYMDIP
jgi:hypothetical protein